MLYMRVCILFHPYSCEIFIGFRLKLDERLCIRSVYYKEIEYTEAKTPTRHAAEIEESIRDPIPFFI